MGYLKDLWLKIFYSFVKSPGFVEMELQGLDGFTTGDFVNKKCLYTNSKCRWVYDPTTKTFKPWDSGDATHCVVHLYELPKNIQTCFE